MAISGIDSWDLLDPHLLVITCLHNHNVMAVASLHTMNLPFTEILNSLVWDIYTLLITEIKSVCILMSSKPQGTSASLQLMEDTLTSPVQKL